MRKHIERRCRIVKAQDEKQVLFCPVYEPNIPDADDQFMTMETIEKAAWDFMKEYSRGEAGLGLDHNSEVGVLDRNTASLVESWIEKADITYETPRGPEVVKQGTWMVGIHIPDQDLWTSAKTMERSGLSFEGEGIVG